MAIAPIIIMELLTLSILKIINKTFSLQGGRNLIAALTYHFPWVLVQFSSKYIPWNLKSNWSLINNSLEIEDSGIETFAVPDNILIAVDSKG